MKFPHPKALSASGRWRCRSAGSLADRKGANLSNAPDHDDCATTRALVLTRCSSTCSPVFAVTRAAACFGSGAAGAGEVTAVTVDISISSWRKSHPLSEEHVAHTDEAEVSNKERTIQRLVDDRDMWRALGKTSLAERAEEAIAKLRDAKPAHNSKGRGRDPYEAAILRAEKARRRADGP